MNLLKKIGNAIVNSFRNLFSIKDQAETRMTVKEDYCFRLVLQRGCVIAREITPHPTNPKKVLMSRDNGKPLVWKKAKVEDGYWHLRRNHHHRPTLQLGIDVLPRHSASALAA